MRIGLMREFIILSKNLNFSKTAQQLYITQSVLSKHIAMLEQQLGAPLFVRNRQSVELTAIGVLFLEEAVDIVRRYDEALEKITIALSKSTQELKIGYLDAHSRNILVPALQRFERKFPNIRLRLITNEYAELSQRLKFKEFDIILTLKFDDELSSWCNIYNIDRDVLCAVVRYDHMIAESDGINLASLASERIILPDSEHFTDFAAFVSNIIENEGLSENVTARYPHVNSALLMVEAGMGVSILPGKLVFNANEKIRFLPIEGKQYSFDVIAAWNKNNNNPPIAQFIAELSDCR